MLWRNKLCGPAPGRTAGPVGTAFDGFRRAVDGLLSPEQAADGRVPRHVAQPAVLPGADGERLRAATCELFEHWADYRDGKISRAALVRRMGPVRRKVERLLLRGMQSNNSDVRGTCRELYEHRQWLWAFLYHEGVEPTNNAGERSLRHAVIWRKLSFGTQSASGSRFVETMLTVIETCRQQRRNAFTFITAAVEAHLAHQSTPSLLPRV